MKFAVRDAKRSNAKRSTARARDTCTTHATQHVSAQHYSAHNTVHIQGKVCTASTAPCCVHSRAIFPRVILSFRSVCATILVASCTELSPDKIFSKDTAFQHALSTVPSQLLTAIKGSALDQPGVLVAYMEGVLEDGTEGSGIGVRLFQQLFVQISYLWSLSLLTLRLLSRSLHRSRLPLCLHLSPSRPPSPGTLSEAS